jgi:glycogen phosphorylase
LPAADAYQAHVADKGAAVRKLMEGRNALAERLDAIRFGTVNVETQGNEHHITVEVFLKDVSPHEVRVELYAEGDEHDGVVKNEMTKIRRLTSSIGGYAYTASVPSTRPAIDYTARIVVRHDPAARDMEAGWILWQK